jgi:hypothetical protein
METCATHVTSVVPTHESALFKEPMIMVMVHPIHGPVSPVSGLIPDQTKINMLVWVGLTLHGFAGCLGCKSERVGLDGLTG